jgi:hypothetical protein
LHGRLQRRPEYYLKIRFARTVPTHAQVPTVKKERTPEAFSPLGNFLILQCCGSTGTRSSHLRNP